MPSPHTPKAPQTGAVTASAATVDLNSPSKVVNWLKNAPENIRAIVAEEVKAAQPSPAKKQTRAKQPSATAESHSAGHTRPQQDALPSSMSGLPHLKELHLGDFASGEGNGVGEDGFLEPKALYGCHSLTWLSLKTVCMHAVPEWASVCQRIQAISRIQRLDINECELCGVPPSDWCFPALTALSITDCGLSAVPPGSLHIGTLTALDLSRNCKLAVLPAGAYLASLQLLDVGYTGISRVPRALASAVRLQELFIGTSGQGVPLANVSPEGAKLLPAHCRRVLEKESRRWPS
ncbi:hypothetical protein WJX84_008541 [Apatococcus fuscideae]|uniref:Uncharacterized protein n=1 Tax=Apatococcus fuscideae TaxID=2026836 RepID=A0AAW1T7P4_9CHLO